MVARYLQLAALLRDAISEGEYPPGTTLPTVAELIERYGYSKSTISRAIELLAEEGLVDPIKKRGTVVREAPPVRVVVKVSLSRYQQVLATGGSLGPWETACRDQGLAGGMKTISVDHMPAAPNVAARLGVAPGEMVIVRSRYATIDDEPAQIQHAHYPLARFAGTPIAAPEKVVGGIYAALLALGITPAEADEGITSRVATEEEAAALKIRPTWPVLVFQRVTRDSAGDAVEYLHVVADPARTEFLYDGLPLTS